MPISLEDCMCPITSAPMQHAMRTSTCNHRFEAVAIMGWIESTRRGSAPCPLCRSTLTTEQLINDEAFQQQINDYLRANSNAATETVDATMLADEAARQSTLRLERDARDQQRHAEEAERQRLEELRITEESSRQHARVETASQRLRAADEAIRRMTEQDTLLALQRAERRTLERLNELNQRFRQDFDRRISNGEIHFPELFSGGALVRRELGISSVHDQATYDRLLQRDQELYRQQQEHVRLIGDILDRRDHVSPYGTVCVRRDTSQYQTFRDYTIPEYRSFREREISREALEIEQRQRPMQRVADPTVNSELQIARDWYVNCYMPLLQQSSSFDVLRQMHQQAQQDGSFDRLRQSMQRALAGRLS